MAGADGASPARSRSCCKRLYLSNASNIFCATSAPDAGIWALVAGGWTLAAGGWVLAGAGGGWPEAALG